MQSILKKSLLIVVSAVLIISVYFIAGVLIFSNNQYNDINTGNLEEAARMLKNFTPPEVFRDPVAVAEWASRLSSPEAASVSYHRVTLINRNGQVIFDTEVDSSFMENHLNRSEFQAAVRTGIGSSRRESATLGQYHLYSAVAIYDSAGELAGVLRLSRLVTGFFPRLLNRTLLFFIFGLVVILGACAGLYHFSRRLSLSVEVRLEKELAEKTAELQIKAEEAETESRHREVILNSMFDGLISVDGNLNIIHVNTRLCTLFGIDIIEGIEDTVRGMSLLSFSRSAELEEAARQVLSTGEPHEITLKRFVSGVEQNLQVFAAPSRASSNGGSRGVVMVLGDISRLVRLEQVRKDFAANVSHELRTPIHVIQGFAENILDSVNQDEIYRFAEIIKKNALYMENITADLLTLVSLEDKDTVRPPMEENALSPLIEEAVKIVSTAARKKNIDIDVSCPPEISLHLYDSLFIQAMFNLLENAVKYSDSGSRIKVNANVEGDHLIIEVKDKGIGIPAVHLDRIFERFYRVDKSRRKTEGSETGTGLGLSIVRHIAMLHHGTVEVESHAGEGSVFRLRLPKAAGR